MKCSLEKHKSAAGQAAILGLDQIRKDYLTDRLVIIAADRPRLSIDLRAEEREEGGSCAFCPGNESQTGPADLVLSQRGGSLTKLSDSEFETVKDWCVRVFPSKYPAVTPEALPNYSETPLYGEPAYGYHYIVVATPKHDEDFSKIDIDQWVNVLIAVQDKVKHLYMMRGVSYVPVFINYGRQAGASLSHPYLQIMTLPRLPPLVEAEALAYQKSERELGICPMCNIVSVEKGGPRQILTTDHYLAFCPWAPAHPYEYWVYPKRHQTSILKVTQREMRDLALILRSTLGGLFRAAGKPPFNLVFHTSSEKKTTRQIHWHIEVYPRLGTWAGLERGMGVYVNQVPPEKAAEELGSSSRREMAELLGIK